MRFLRPQRKHLSPKKLEKSETQSGSQSQTGKTGKIEEEGRRSSSSTSGMTKKIDEDANINRLPDFEPNYSTKMKEAES